MITLPKSVIAPIHKFYDWLGGTFTFQNGQFVRSYGSTESDTGEVITETSALRIVTLLRCVTLIAGAGASLPIDVGQRQNGMRRILEGHPVERVLDSEPNPEMSSMEFRSQQWLSFLLWANSFARIVRDGERIVALWPMFPHLMKVGRNEVGDLQYTYEIPGKEPETYGERDILHIRWYSLDGLIGLNPIQLAANSLGLHRATDRAAGKFYKNGAFVNMQMKFPATLQQKQVDQVRADFLKNYSTQQNGYNVAIMPGGSELQGIGVNPVDAQLLQQREFNDYKICTLFGVPPHMVGLTEKTTSWGTGIESQKQGFLDFTVAPLLTFFEKAYERALLSKSERNIYIKHNTRGFLRADFAGRMEAYATGVDKGIFNRDEARGWEDMNPIPDGSGQTYTVQSQMIPLNMVGKITQPSRPPKEGADVNA